MQNVTLSTGKLDLGKCERVVTSWNEFSNFLLKPIEIPHNREYIKHLSLLSKSNSPDAPRANRELRELKGANGYFVGGEFKTPLAGTSSFARKSYNLLNRTLITLDADNAPIDFAAQIARSPLGPYIGTYYTTFSHEFFKPKARIVIPLKDSVSPEKYQPIARKVAEMLSPDLSWFDTVSFVEAQVMFFPVICKGAEFAADSWGFAYLDGNEILNLYPRGQWQDSGLWPKTPKEIANPKTYAIDTLNDPRDKPGLIGAFCKAYDIHDAIETFLPDKYVGAGANRYTHLGGNGHGGAVVYDGGTHLFSSHDNDPCNTRTCHNAFDLVRIHKFGDMDKVAPPGTLTNNLPSFKAMLEFASRDPAIATMGFDVAGTSGTSNPYAHVDPKYQNLPKELMELLGFQPAPESLAPKPKPLTVGQIEDDIIEVLSGRKGRCANSPGDLEKWYNVDTFQSQYKVVAPMIEFASPMIVKIGDSCKIAEPEEVVLDLIDWLREATKQDMRFLPYFKDSSHLTRWVKLWTYKHTDLKELPKPLALKSDPELTMNRLDCDPLTCSAAELPIYAPTFYSMLERVETNRMALVQRIGSIFDMQANRKQAVWLYGESDAGKSTFSWLISRLTGPKPVCTLSKELLQSAFFTQNLVGRRIALVPEAGPWFIRQDRFKALTGDRVHGVNPKGKSSYSANIDTLFFFFSNDKPEIINSSEFLNRIIDCHITPVPRHLMLDEYEIQRRLESEIPFIIGYCMAEYAKLGSGKRIPVNQETLKEIAEDFQSSEYEFAEKYLKYGDATEANIHEHVTPNQLCLMYAEWLGEKRNGYREKDLKNFLRREFGASIRKREFQGKTKRIWLKILWRDPSELIALNPDPVSPAQIKSHLTIVPPPF